MKLYRKLRSIASLALLMALTSTAHALDYAYVTNNGTITITKYIGSGGDITIPDTINGLPVTTIGSRFRTPEWSAWGVAFVNRDNLTSITIPDSVTTIGQAEFRYCKGLTHVSIGSGVTHIDEWAFSCCWNLIGIAVDDRNPAFSSLDGILFDKNKTRLVKCPRSKTADFVIPNSVTAIGDFAFQGSTNRTNIVIPDGVTYIGAEAFSGWRKLTNITIPDSVTFLGDNAFDHCYDLTRISIPDSVTSIGNEAFYSSSLTHVDIGSGVTNIGKQAFGGNENLLKITVDEQNPAFSSFNGALLDKNHLTLIKCPRGKTGSFVIPDTVTAIADFALIGCTNRTGVIIPDGVISIGDWAFAFCKDLTNITIPDRVTSIGDSAFRGCRSLTNVTLGANITSIGDEAFAGCSQGSNEMFSTPDIDHLSPPPPGLASITIPAHCDRIGNDVFDRCNSLTNISVNVLNSSFSSVEGVLYNHDRTELIMCPPAKAGVLIIPDSVETIADSAFKGCARLTSITIPDSVCHIGSSAFLNCSGLRNISIGSGVTTIGNQAFRGCKRLTHITLPDQVTAIDTQTFESCWKLKIVDIPKGVTSIGSNAFKGCASLTDLTIPEGVEFVGPGAFSYCKKLSSITIPDCVTTIEPMTFQNCERLSGIVIPDHITSIGQKAFHNCRNLENITIPAGVTTLENEVFSGCSRLRGATILGNVTSIGEGAFSSCGQLRSITIPDGTSSIGKEAFKECKSLSTVTIPDGISTVEAGTFSTCHNLASIALPQTITSIQKEAFAYCRNLEHLSIPDGVSFIGEGAFYGTGLKDITIPDGITSIADRAFNWCSLTNITLPNSVTSIGDRAFSNCKNLRRITIPANVTSIGDKVFERSHGLGLIFFEGNAPSLGVSVFERSSPTILYRSETTGWTGRFGDRSTALFNSEYPEYAYLVTDDGITITRYFGTGGIISFPETIEELPVTTIDSLFLSNLSSLHIPRAVTSIDQNTLNYPSSLASISVDPRNPVYSSKDGVLFDKDKTKLIKFPQKKEGRYKIPESVTSLERSAFRGCAKLMAISIPDNVSHMGRSAFSGCSGLTSVTVPEKVTTIESSTFSGCTNLTQLTTHKNITNIQAYAFSGCASLTNVALPNNITSLDRGVLSGCRKLKSIKIPDNVTTLENGALSGCTSLVNITIPGNVTTLEHSALSGCKGLTSITLPDGLTSIGQRSFKDCTSLTNIVIPETVTSIRQGALAGCTSLENIMLPASVTNIGNQVFGGCSKLAVIEADRINPSYSSTNGVLYNKDKTKIIAYPEGKTGTIHILEGISDVGQFLSRHRLVSAYVVDQNNPSFSSFDGVLYDKDQTTLIACPGGKTGRVYIPANTTSFRQHYTSSRDPRRLPSRSVFDRSDLTEIVVDDQNPAYSSLNGVLYDKGQTTLIHCLRGQSGVIHIPASVTNIMDSFWTCERLTAISVDKQNTAYSSVDGILYNKEQTELLKCPEGKTGSIVLPATVTRIRDRRFPRCDHLTAITVDTNNTAYSSHDGVLLNRSQTTLLKCPKGKAGSYTVPDSVHSIAYGAFSGCTNLTSIILGNNVTRIGSGAFGGCTGLSSITIPDTVTHIDGGAFSGCSSLESVYFKGHAPFADKGGGDRLVEPQFSGSNQATIYFLPENSGWGETYCDRPAELWSNTCVDIHTCLPWTDAHGVKLGMHWSAFEKARPKAKYANIDGYPTSPSMALTGPYIEGDPHVEYSPCWHYYVSKNKLIWVDWLILSRKPADKKIVEELQQIRLRLIKAHGPPVKTDTLRSNTSGKYERITREIYVPRNSKIAIRLTAYSEARGTFIEIEILSTEGIKKRASAEMGKKKDKNRIALTTDEPLIIDLLTPLPPSETKSDK